MQPARDLNPRVEESHETTDNLKPIEWQLDNPNELGAVNGN
jgi:hypothetical protein